MPLTLTNRMEIVEQEMAGLEVLPERMTALELQVLQLREEMRAEFSVTRGEMRSGDEEIQRSLREEIRAGDEETRNQLRAGIGALGTHMRVLHEDVISRLALLQEGQNGRPRRPANSSTRNTA